MKIELNERSESTITTNVYIVVKRNETGRVFDTRVQSKDLASHIQATFQFTTIEILAIIRI